MVTDSQVRKLMKLIQNEKSLAAAAAKASMDEKTARKYRELGKLPSELKVERNWRTREDPFAEIWDEIRDKLLVNSGFEAKTLFEDVQRRYPGRFQEGQMRTLQRRVKIWRATEGSAKEVFFPQVHRPGELSQSDFTHMDDLGVTIEGAPFPHLVYHFVLTYSNWEAGTVCFTESFESLSVGLQNALWKLGGVPPAHQTDRLSAAVHKMDHPEEFTVAYRALLKHYGMEGRKIQARKANENGDIEQRHHRFKRAVEQALLFRNSRDFPSRKDYEKFLMELFSQLNKGRRKRLEEELTLLRRLPARRLESYKRLSVRVGPGSTIRVQHNVYSVHSRLIGETVDVRIHPDHLEVWYAQRCVEKLPRLRGSSKHRVDYRHVIDWLVRKPGAFVNYRYREDLFPSSRFRMAYDALNNGAQTRGDKVYLRMLDLAAKEGEALVEHALEQLLDAKQPVTVDAVEKMVEHNGQDPASVAVAAVEIKEVGLEDYDSLLGEQKEDAA